MKKILTIGRQSGNDIVIDQREVSRMHAKVGRTETGDYYLEDASMNGTTVNGRDIKNRRIVLTQGDDLRLAGKHPVYWSQIMELLPPTAAGGGTGATNWMPAGKTGVWMPAVLAVLLLALGGYFLNDRYGWFEGSSSANTTASIGSGGSGGAGTGSSGISYISSAERDSIIRQETAEEAAARRERERQENLERENARLKRELREAKNRAEQTAIQRRIEANEQQQEQQRRAVKPPEPLETQPPSPVTTPAKPTTPNRFRQLRTDPPDAPTPPTGNSEPPSGNRFAGAARGTQWIGGNGSGSADGSGGTPTSGIPADFGCEDAFAQLYRNVDDGLNTVKGVLNRKRGMSDEDIVRYEAGREALDKLEDEINDVYHPARGRMRNAEVGRETCHELHQRFARRFGAVRDDLQL